MLVQLYASCGPKSAFANIVFGAGVGMGVLAWCDRVCCEAVEVCVCADGAVP